MVRSGYSLWPPHRRTLYYTALCIWRFKWRKIGDACWGAGFALEGNASDMLMVKCPLPPVEQWDEVLRERLLFLLDQRLAPQLFLPAGSLPADDKQVRQPRLPHRIAAVSDTGCRAASPSGTSLS